MHAMLGLRLVLAVWVAVAWPFPLDNVNDDVSPEVTIPGPTTGQALHYTGSGIPARTPAPGVPLDTREDGNDTTDGDNKSIDDDSGGGGVEETFSAAAEGNSPLVVSVGGSGSSEEVEDDASTEADDGGVSNVEDDASTEADDGGVSNVEDDASTEAGGGGVSNVEGGGASAGGDGEITVKLGESKEAETDGGKTAVPEIKVESSESGEEIDTEQAIASAERNAEYSLKAETGTENSQSNEVDVHEIDDVNTTGPAHKIGDEASEDDYPTSAEEENEEKEGGEGAKELEKLATDTIIAQATSKPGSKETSGEVSNEHSGEVSNENSGEAAVEPAVGAMVAPSLREVTLSTGKSGDSDGGSTENQAGIANLADVSTVETGADDDDAATEEDTENEETPTDPVVSTAYAEVTATPTENGGENDEIPAVKSGEASGEEDEEVDTSVLAEILVNHELHGPENEKNKETEEESIDGDVEAAEGAEAPSEDADAAPDSKESSTTEAVKQVRKKEGDEDGDVVLFDVENNEDDHHADNDHDETGADSDSAEVGEGATRIKHTSNEHVVVSPVISPIANDETSQEVDDQAEDNKQVDGATSFTVVSGGDSGDNNSGGVDGDNNDDNEDNDDAEDDAVGGTRATTGAAAAATDDENDDDEDDIDTAEAITGAVVDTGNEKGDDHDGGNDGGYNEEGDEDEESSDKELNVQARSDEETLGLEEAEELAKSEENEQSVEANEDDIENDKEKGDDNTDGEKGDGDGDKAEAGSVTTKAEESDGEGGDEEDNSDEDGDKDEGDEEDVGDEEDNSDEDGDKDEGDEEDVGDEEGHTDGEKEEDGSDENSVETVEVTPVKPKIMDLDEAEALYSAEHGEDGDEGSGAVDDEIGLIESNDPHSEDDHSSHDDDQHTQEADHGASHAGDGHHKDTAEDKESKKRTAIIVGVAVGGVALFTITFFASRQCKQKKDFKAMQKTKEQSDPDTVEFRPIHRANTAVSEDVAGDTKNGLYRHGPRMGPPSPRVHRKTEGKFAFPDNHKNGGRLSPTAAPTLAPLLGESPSDNGKKPSPKLNIPSATGNGDNSSPSGDGLYRQGPRMGPPSPRMTRKSDGKFAFPVKEGAGTASPSPDASPSAMPLTSFKSGAENSEPLIIGVEKLKYIDESTDDEGGATDKLLPLKSRGQSLDNVEEETAPASPSVSQQAPPTPQSDDQSNGLAKGGLVAC